MNYDPRWSPQYQPMYPYPPQQEVRFIQVPTNSTGDAVQILKKELKDLKRKHDPNLPQNKKAEEKKKPALSYLECVAIVFMSGPFVMLIYGGIIFTTAKVIKSLL